MLKIKRLVQDAIGVVPANWPLNTRLPEGINNRIKVIRQMAYGFSDDEYFFLKIRNAFPGIA